MTPTPPPMQDDAHADAPGPALLAQLLGAVETSLVQQIELASSSDYDSLAIEMDHAAALLKQAEGLPKIPMEAFAHIAQHIKQLETQLGITLTLQKQEIAAQLLRYQAGRKMLDAYKQ